MGMISSSCWGHGDAVTSEFMGIYLVLTQHRKVGSCLLISDD